MHNYTILSLDDLAEQVSELFEVTLISLGYNAKLKNLHNLILNDSDPNDITSISMSNACNLLYLSIKSSRNFSFKNENHRIIITNRKSFENLYNEIILKVFNILNLEKSNYLYQKIPTIRVQYPGTNSSPLWHRDIDFGHPKGEINFWIPLTEVFPTSTLWFRKEKEYYSNVNIGSALCFNGEIVHGTRINMTNYTRVSMDFRIISKKDFDIYLKTSKDRKTIARQISLIDYYYGE